MKTDRLLVLTDGEGNYIIDDKENYDVKQTTDIRLATNYRFNLTKWISKNAAERKYSKKFEFKKFIPLSGSFDIPLDVKASMAKGQLTSIEKIVLCAFGLAIFMALVKEQGFVSAIVLIAILIKVFLIPTGSEDNSEGLIDKKEN